MSRLIPTLLTVAILSGAAMAAPIVIDGQLSDWGIGVADANVSAMNTYAGTGGIGFLGVFSEDQNDNDNSHYLGPNHGGQNYDAELIAAATDGSFLYVAIVSGQRPDNGFRAFGPGDIRITAGGVTYGIEVGGGRGGVAVAGVLEEGGDGATYALDGSGHTIGFAAHALPDTQVAGSMWRDPNWILDPINPKGPTQLADQFIGGDYAGQIDYVYTLNHVTDQHAIMEMAIPLSWLGGAGLLEIHWRPSCGNDELDLYVTGVPEPASSMLLVLGGLGLGALLLRERRRRS